MNPEIKNVNVKPYCGVCGSSAVSIEVDSEWDQTIQQWIIACQYDDGYCRDCGGIKARTFEWRET